MKFRKEIIGDATLYLGDCREVCAEITPQSISACVTDPPYGLQFMGEDWDHGVPGEHYWGIIAKTMKPGAHLLAFGGTRTYHRLVCAIEDAGFEIRDCLMWVYGSGMPKSLDISKNIDKAAGAEREIIGKRKHPTLKDTTKIEEQANAVHGNNAWAREWPITAPATDESKLWDGYGTGLKPAHEPISLSMKALDGTFANNALTHGVAGLNIDGSRIPLNGETPPSGSAKIIYRSNQYTDEKRYGTNTHTPKEGRFPANFIHDGSEEVTSLFPETGESTGGGMKDLRKGKLFQGETNPNITNHCGFGDKGSAARYFYCAKPSKSERGEGNNHPTLKPRSLMKYLVTLVSPPQDGCILDPFMGSGTIGLACIDVGVKFIGVEQDENFFDIACHRIEQACKSPYEDPIPVLEPVPVKEQTTFAWEE